MGCRIFRGVLGMADGMKKEMSEIKEDEERTTMRIEWDRAKEIRLERPI